jgi:signal transduction histidine kinase
VFDLFAQAPTSLDRSEGGLGVGLAMVKGLAELHGGRATAFSEGPGRGSRFEVWIPLAAAHQRGSEPGPVELSSTGVGAK